MSGQFFGQMPFRLIAETIARPRARHLTLFGAFDSLLPRGDFGGREQMLEAGEGYPLPLLRLKELSLISDARTFRKTLNELEGSRLVQLIEVPGRAEPSWSDQEYSISVDLGAFLGLGGPTLTRPFAQLHDLGGIRGPNGRPLRATHGLIYGIYAAGLRLRRRQVQEWSGMQPTTQRRAEQELLDCGLLEPSRYGSYRGRRILKPVNPEMAVSSGVEVTGF